MRTGPLSQRCALTFQKSAKTRIQALPAGIKCRSNDLTLTKVLARIYQEEGVTGLYRGFGATMLNTFSMRKSFSLHSFTNPYHGQNTPTSSSTRSSEHRISIAERPNSLPEQSHHHSRLLQSSSLERLREALHRSSLFPFP